MDPQSTPVPDDKGKELQAIQDSIAKLGESVESVIGRVDNFETTLQGIASPPVVEEPAPQPKWQPKTWDEFPQMAEQVARQIVEETEAQKLAHAEEIKKQEQDVVTQIDKDFDATLQKLEDDGLIPSIKDAKNPDDPGKVVRKELFALGVKYNSPDLASMASLRNELVTNGFSFDYKSGKILRNPSPLGAGAPVGSPSGNSGGGNKPSYKEIHALSMDEMIRRYNQ